MLWGPSRHLGSLTAANWVSFDFNVSYSSCGGYSLINTSAPTASPPMQLKWCTSADKRKTSRHNPMGNKPAWRSRPSEAVRSWTDFFSSPSSRLLPQVRQRRHLSTNFPTFVPLFYWTQSQGNSCMAHPHTQASPS